MELLRLRQNRGITATVEGLLSQVGRVLQPCDRAALSLGRCNHCCTLSSCGLRTSSGGSKLTALATYKSLQV